MKNLSSAHVVSKLKKPVARYYLKAIDRVTRLSLRNSAPRDLSHIRIVTAVRRQNGISSGAELQAAALTAEGYDALLVDGTDGLRNPLFRAKHAPGTTYVYHSGGPQTPNFILATLKQSRSAYRIAYWAWELPTPPLTWPWPKGLVSEVWTPSRFSRDALLGRSDVPVRVVPHRVPSRARRERPASGPFTILALADSRSSFDRKNPLGAIDAFLAAFGEDLAVRLIVKLNGGSSAVTNFQHELGGRVEAANIEIIAEFLSPAGMDELFDRADVLLSLHRAEGFGLPMLEAMARGIPVVATGWSGNMDFMDAGCACLIDYELVPVKDKLWYSHYSASHWAEPDVGQAAEVLSRLRSDWDYYSRIAERGWLAAGFFDKQWLAKAALSEPAA